MVENVLQTDEREDLITSLTMLSLALAQTQKDLSFWKWAVIATHNALQNAMVCHLGSKGSGYLLVRKNDVKKWFEAQEASTPYPKDLDSFFCLYEKIKMKRFLDTNLLHKAPKTRTLGKSMNGETISCILSDERGQSK